MATAVLVPISTINSNGGVLPPSAVSQNAPRHGRSRGASVVKGRSAARGRGYSLIDERDAVVSKALALVLKRSRSNAEDSSEDGGDDSELSADPEGWVDLDDVLGHAKISSLNVTYAEAQRVIASSTAKGRLAIRLSDPDGDAEDPASYQIRRAPLPTQPHKEALQTSSSVWTTVTSNDEDLPEFIVFDTSYPKYHLILTSGSIKRAGGQPHLTFTPVAEDSLERRTTNDADVSIWIRTRSVLEFAQGITWKKTESGNFITSHEVPKDLWDKAVARRGDLGVLFENGQVRKEIPVGLRGKGAKAKKGKGALKSRVEDDGSGSSSD